MTVGQIQRNYIQDNSVGIGFFGYSGFSGWSGWSGQTGPAGGINVSAGKYAWVMDVMVFDDNNGDYNVLKWFHNTPLYSAWGLKAIRNPYDMTPPGAFWVDSDSTATGFTTKMRIKAVLDDYYAGSGSLYALRIRKLNAASYEYPWEASMASYADNNLLVTDDRNFTFWGPVVTSSEASAYKSAESPAGASGEVSIMPSAMVGPWVTIPGDGYYMVEVWDWHLTGSSTWPGGFYPKYIFLEFAKVKN